MLHSVQSDSPALCESCWLLRHFRFYSTSVLLTFYWYVKWQRNVTVEQFSRNLLVKVTSLLCMKGVYVIRCKCNGTDDLSLLGCDTFIWRLVPVPSASLFLDRYNWDYIPMTHQHIPEDLNPRQQCCENVTCVKNCCYVESESQRKTVCCFELSAVLCVIVKSAR